MKLPTQTVEKHLSAMILDKKLNGILDQGVGQLLIFDNVVDDKLYDKSLAVMTELGHVVDELYVQANQLR